MDVFRSWPFPAAVAVLFAIAFLRGNATYWLARAARTGAGHTRVKAMFASPGYQRAERIVGRWGAPAVTLCFLTVGVQTMINLVAGATRMPLRSYLPAVTVGAVLWGLLYATFGAFSWSVLIRLYQVDPVLAIVLGVVLVGGLAAFVIIRLRSGRARAAESNESYEANESNEVVPDRINRRR